MLLGGCQCPLCRRELTDHLNLRARQGIKPRRPGQLAVNARLESAKPLLGSVLSSDHLVSQDADAHGYQGDPAPRTGSCGLSAPGNAEQALRDGTEAYPASKNGSTQREP